MAKADVKKYFKMLEENQYFLKMIIDTGEDKTAKMAVIRSHGMDFTKDEFVEVALECRLAVAQTDMLNDSDLEHVAGGFIISGIFGVAIGATIGDVLGVAVGGGVGIAAGIVTCGALAPGIVASTAAGATVGAAVGAVIGGGVGFAIPFV